MMCYMEGTHFLLNIAKCQKKKRKCSRSTNSSVLSTRPSFRCYLQLQLWVVSHVNQQAVEGGQALRVSLTAGTPWMEMAHGKFTVIQQKRGQTEAHKGKCQGREPTERLFEEEVSS